MSDFKSDLETILQADDEQISQLNSKFLRKRAREVKRLAEEVET